MLSSVGNGISAQIQGTWTDASPFNYIPFGAFKYDALRLMPRQYMLSCSTTAARGQQCLWAYPDVAAAGPPPLIICKTGRGAGGGAMVPLV